VQAVQAKEADARCVSEERYRADSRVRDQSGQSDVVAAMIAEKAYRQRQAMVVRAAAAQGATA
jgi:hypothetical protein